MQFIERGSIPPRVVTNLRDGAYETDGRALPRHEARRARHPAGAASRPSIR